MKPQLKSLITKFLALMIILLLVLSAVAYINRKEFDYKNVYLDAQTLDIHHENGTLTLSNSKFEKLTITLKGKSDSDFLNNFYVYGKLLRPKEICNYLSIEINLKNVNNDEGMIRYVRCGETISDNKLLFYN